MEQVHQAPGPAERPTIEAVSHKPLQYPKWFGGSASCMAVVCSHPLDLIKVRLQTTPLDQRKGVFGTLFQILRLEGIKGPYQGLSAGLLRQLTYGSTRFAVYESAKDLASSRSNGKSPPFALLFPAAFVSGSVGAIVGNPADMANVRMQNDMSLPLHQRQNYRSALDVLARIIREQGPGGLLRGVLPNSVRAGAMTACQLACYDGFKDALMKSGLGFKDGVVTQLTASLLSGLVATTACSPIDVIKTRIMSLVSSGGKVSIWGTVRTLTRTEGVKWAFRGWVPSFARMGPHTAATLLFLEQHRRLYRRFVVGEDESRGAI